MDRGEVRLGEGEWFEVVPHLQPADRRRARCVSRMFRRLVDLCFHVERLTVSDCLPAEVLAMDRLVTSYHQLEGEAGADPEPTQRKPAPPMHYELVHSMRAYLQPVWLGDRLRSVKLVKREYIQRAECDPLLDLAWLRSLHSLELDARLHLKVVNPRGVLLPQMRRLRLHETDFPSALSTCPQLERLACSGLDLRRHLGPADECQPHPLQRLRIGGRLNPAERRRLDRLPDRLEKLTVDFISLDLLQNLQLELPGSLRRLHVNLPEAGVPSPLPSLIHKLHRRPDMKQVELRVHGLQVGSEPTELERLRFYLKHLAWGAERLGGFEFNRRKADKWRSRQLRAAHNWNGCTCDASLARMLRLPLVEEASFPVLPPQRTLAALSTSWTGLQRLSLRLPEPSEVSVDCLRLLPALRTLRGLWLEEVRPADCEPLDLAIRRLPLLTDVRFYLVASFEPTAAEVERMAGCMFERAAANRSRLHLMLVSNRLQREFSCQYLTLPNFTGTFPIQVPYEGSRCTVDWLLVDALNTVD